MGKREKSLLLGVSVGISLLLTVIVVHAINLDPPVSDDPLVRMPGTQPSQGDYLKSPESCLGCHEGYDPSVEPGFNWKGSMMAQAARDFVFWATMTVAGQDSAWAIGTPNAIDICERCHFPEGWLEGRSEPPNASAMIGSDFDGVHCDFCHQAYDPFFEDTFLEYGKEMNIPPTGMKRIFLTPLQVMRQPLPTRKIH
jgi:hypothetical protein